MPHKSLAQRALIDEFLPDYNFAAAYHIGIGAPPAVVYQHLMVTDFSEQWVVRLLMALRTGRRVRRNRAPVDLRQRLQGTGFIVLADAPNDELVIGIAGRFWRPDGGRCLDLSAADFASFSRPGWAKAAWNFKLTTESAATTRLSTETRIQCLGRAALWKFRLYWALVGSFSGLIRKAILQQVKVESERAALTLPKSAC